jgi:hypothetical protein
LATITALKSFIVQANAECHNLAIFLTVTMTSVVMLSAIILSVVAPRTSKQPENDEGEKKVGTFAKSALISCWAAP